MNNDTIIMMAMFISSKSLTAVIVLIVLCFFPDDFSGHEANMFVFKLCFFFCLT